MVYLFTRPFLHRVIAILQSEDERAGGEHHQEAGCYNHNIANVDNIYISIPFNFLY